MYRVRYRFCNRDDYTAHMEGEAQEKVDLHQGLCHHHDDKDCAHYEQIAQSQADRKEVSSA